jgi:hypothetical protein
MLSPIFGRPYSGFVFCLVAHITVSSFSRSLLLWSRLLFGRSFFVAPITVSTFPVTAMTWKGHIAISIPGLFLNVTYTHTH